MSACALPDGDGTRLAVQAVPRASRSEVVGLHGDTVRIRLNAPPVDGKANRALLEFLSGVLKVPLRSLALTSGETGRRKSVRVAGLPPADVLRRLGLPPAASSSPANPLSLAMRLPVSGKLAP